jgi:hypothetical protein
VKPALCSEAAFWPSPRRAQPVSFGAHQFRAHATQESFAMAAFVRTFRQTGQRRRDRGSELSHVFANANVVETNYTRAMTALV